MTPMPVPADPRQLSPRREPDGTMVISTAEC
jgi:hypothetical protein